MCLEISDFAINMWPESYESFLIKKNEPKKNKVGAKTAKKKSKKDKK